MSSSDYNWPRLLEYAKEAINTSPHPSWRGLAKHLNIPRSTLQEGFERELSITSLGQIANNLEMGEPQVAPIFHDKKVPEDVDWRELVKIAQDVKDVEDNLDETQRIANITIETDKPISIMFTGDWQLGDLAVNYKQWVRDMQFVLDTPNLYMAAMGDEIQNMRAFKTLSAVLGQALTPKLQGQLLKSIIDELTEKNKLLCKIYGNHDAEFDERIFGERLVKYLLEKTKAPIFNNRGLINLTVGQEKYTLLLFHKSRFKSFLRATHGEKREHQLSFPADVVCGAHDHEPAYELISSYTLARDAGYPFGGFSYLVKVGTFQDSSFGFKFFHNGGLVFNPTIVFWPDSHKMQIFNTPEDATAFTEAL